MFDVTAEGLTVIDNLDVFAKAGGKNGAYVHTVRAKVMDGRLSLGFHASRDNAVLAGIEVVPAAVMPPAVSPSFGTTPTGTTQRPLSWKPPVLTSPTTVAVTNGKAFLTLETGKDYIVKLPSTPLTSKGGVTINGGRNVVMIGGEIGLPSASAAPASNDRRGLLLKQQTGTVHIEGVHISGPDVAEGIDLDQRLGRSCSCRTSGSTRCTAHKPVITPMCCRPGPGRVSCGSTA